MVLPVKWQWGPVNPDRHVHIGLLSFMEHVPPLRQVKQLQLLQKPVEESEEPPTI